MKIHYFDGYLRHLDTKERCDCNRKTVYPSYSDPFKVFKEIQNKEGDYMSFERIVIAGKEYDLVPVEPVVADNPFKIGDYVKVITPKRVGHRDGGVGKVIATAPVTRWDNETMPMVYVEFPNHFNGCGSANGAVNQGHGCRMPVSGLEKVS